ncbi:MAG TPA: hypothetical protein VMB03_26750 [Bryobacteraceae bacterium]|nr:hypothetical protein [Bryobacteraceae bacterium]
MRAIVIGKVFCVAALLWGAMPSPAATFSFSYSGTGTGSVTASGTITATQIVGDIYNITGISGMQNGYSMSLASVTSLIYNGSSSVGTLDFLAHGGLDTLSFSGGIFSEAGAVGADTGSNFKLAATVPEISTLLILISMALGVWLLARKLPLKGQSRH